VTLAVSRTVKTICPKREQPAKGGVKKRNKGRKKGEEEEEIRKKIAGSGAATEKKQG